MNPFFLKFSETFSQLFHFCPFSLHNSSFLFLNSCFSHHFFTGIHLLVTFVFLLLSRIIKSQLKSAKKISDDLHTLRPWV